MKKSLTCLFALGLISCSTTKSLDPSLVYMSKDKAPQGCQYKGMIHGSHYHYANGTQINYRLRRTTEYQHIMQAKKLGANYVQMHDSIHGGGKAYACPVNELAGKYHSYK